MIETLVWAKAQFPGNGQIVDSASKGNVPVDKRKQNKTEEGKHGYSESGPAMGCTRAINCSQQLLILVSSRKEHTP